MTSRRAESLGPLLTHPLAIGAGLIVLLGLLRAAVNIHDVFLLGFFALLLAVVLGFPVELLGRWVSRGVAVILTLLLGAGAVAALAAVGVPVVARQLGPLAHQLPEGVRRAQAWLEYSGAEATAAPQGSNVAEHVRAHLDTLVAGAVAHLVPAAFSATELVVTAALVVVLAAFLVYEPEVYRRGLRSLVPREDEPLFDEAWRRLGHDLRQWVGGIVLGMVLMGTFAGAGLAIIGVEGWFVLGLLTLLGTFVPYLGAIASAVPGLVVALAQSPGKFFAACAVYLAVHILEGYLVQPLVMRRAVELKPALLLFGQACLGAVFGLMGVVVATPLLVCGRALVQYLWVERRLGKVDAGA